MIKFIEHKSPKYPPRTYENASADATIAFAFDFNTPGERLTKDAVGTQGKLYIPTDPTASLQIGKINHDASVINENKVLTLNIAGNGLYTTIKYGCTQKKCDTIVEIYLSSLFDSLEQLPTLIRSGGQSGFDESGLKAAAKLGIPALCVCPQGWKFMNEKGETICDKERFLDRFKGYDIL